MKLSTVANRADDEDLFSHTRMSFGDHIEELRMRMIRAILGFLVALVAGLFAGQPMVEFIKAPLKAQLVEFFNHRIEVMRAAVKDQRDVANESEGNFDTLMQTKGTVVTAQIKDPGEGGVWKRIDLRIIPKELGVATAASIQELAPPASLTTLTITEAFMTYFMVSIYCGIILSSPWLFWQAWQFIGAGLYPHERKYVYLYLPLSLGLFLAGCALAEFVVLPLGIRYLLSFNEWLGVEPELRLSEWLGFAVMVPLIFGLAFQLPIVMLFLERMGIVDITLYTKNRRMAFFILAVAAALMAAAPDALNMMLLAVPLWGLYEFGILLCRFTPRTVSDMEEPDPDEMVEG